MTVGQLPIPYHYYVFNLNEKKRYVFFFTCEERPGDPVLVWNSKYEALGMFQRALKGWRHSGEQSLELVLSDCANEQSAREAFQATLGSLIQISPSALPDSQNSR